MRVAKNGSAGAAANSVAGAVVVIKVLVAGTVVGVVGFSGAKQNIEVVARKTADRMILIRLYLSLIVSCGLSDDLDDSRVAEKRVS
jgi:TRAP-type uncharacterized transport system fused permease subunit